MKKIFYLFITFILICSINVFAADGVTLLVECEDLKLSRDAEAVCDLNVSTISTVSVDNVSMDIESNADLIITYNKGQFFDGSLNSGRLVLSSSELKTGNFKLGTIKIKVSENATYEEKTLTFKNIAFTNTNNPTELYNSENVVKQINVLSNNNNLESISIDGELINKFSPETLKYDIEVDAETINITAVAEEKDVVTISGTGEKELEYGKNTFEIKVDNQIGDTKIYVLNITRKDNRSDVNTLKTLTIEGINFDFKSKNLSYKINVDSDVDKIKIDSTLTDNKSSYVKDFGNREVELDYGENKVLIKVVSEKGTEKVYTLNVNREDNRSDVAELSYLKVNNEEIELLKDVYEYDVEVLFRHTKTFVEASVSGIATIEYKDIDLKVGNNKLVIKVISEKETEKEYKINVKRLTEEESKAVLENIKVKGYELNFTKDINNYNLRIDKNVEMLEFEFISNDLESIIYNVDGNNNLKKGSVVTLNVKDDLGEYVYNINIDKEEEAKLILGFLTLDQICYIVFIIGVITFVNFQTFITHPLLKV